MISNPEYGWCNFDLGDFHGTPSYITDVVTDIIEFFIKGIQTGRSIAFFDEEGSEFTLIMNPHSFYLIEEDKECNTRLHDFSEMNISKLIQELITDVEKDIDGWIWFNATNEAEAEKEKSLILQLLSKLK